MALKFRRGTTAQQSGSLAFGEPYVNTTLGTLLIGGPDGDIVLSSTGTGSTGNFGAISGSGLDITGNARIGGNLTLGGNITIGDTTTDNVVINADLSSSLIPNDDNAFDIGSTSKRYKTIYGNEISASQLLIQSGSNPQIRLINDVTGIEYHIQNGDAGNFQIHNGTTGKLLFKFDSGSIADGNQDVRFYSDLHVSKSITAHQLAAEFIVAGGFTGSLSGSVAGIGNVSTYSASVESKFESLVALTGSTLTRLTNLESTSASVNTSVSNLNTFSGSALTRLSVLEVETSNLESFTSSINTTIKSKLNADGVISGSSQILGGSGLVSGSSQITLSETTGFSGFSSSVDSRITTEKGRVDAILSAADADKDSFAEIVTLINSVDTTNDSAFASFYTASVGRLSNLESTSASVNISVSNLNTYTGSNNTTNTTQNSRLDQLSTASGSAITRLTALEVETSNLESFSSSALTRLTTLEVETSNLESFTSSINTTIKNKLNVDGVVSGSSQINVASTTGDIVLGTRTSGNYVASLVAGTNITLSNNSGEGATPTIGLTNNTISGISLGSNLATLTIGTGLSGTSYNGSTGVTIANTGVTSNVAGTGVTVSGATGAVTISIGQAVATSDNVRFNSLGIGMAASATAGRIDAANDIVAYSSSDIRFKENIKPIENALDKISKISGNTYDWKAENKAEHGYEGNDVGVIAQEIEAVLPQLVQNRDNGYKAVKYDKLVALLIQGIKEQQLQIEELKAKIGL
jgi:hypothetical protein